MNTGQIKGTDMTGWVSGGLVVLRFAGRSERHWMWLCQCDCGKQCVVSGANIRHGQKSCGCRQHSGKHGHGKTSAQSPEYRSWQSMKIRCLSPSHESYQHYGARGITVCQRWLNSFENFLADMGPRPQHCSIERIDLNGNYEPTNCRWATQKEQQNNTSRTVFLEYNGQTKPLSVWADEMGIHRGTLTARIRRGWSTERALTKVVINRGIKYGRAKQRKQAAA